MKLYIPTTSLNFNNILSTESISPKGFYALRGFGYSRWFSIPENDFDGAILLYESPAEIIRPKSDIEDHPLLIEMETDDSFPIAKEGIRYSKQTIYLNPWKTKFYFQSEEDRTIAFSLSDSSLETKMLRLYNKNIKVDHMQGEFPTLNGISEDMSLEDSYIKVDRLINKIKGLLYGYYIGAGLSASNEDISELNVLKEIQNIFAAVASSLERKPTFNQMERLEQLFGYFVKKEPLYREILSELGKEDVTDKVFTILQKYGINVSNYDWRYIVNELQYDNGKTNSAIIWVKSEISKLQNGISSRKSLLKSEAEEIITSDYKVSKISSIANPEENALYISWVNNVFIKEQFNGKVSSTKEDLADAITKAAIDSLGEKWSDSSYRAFLNQLRKHVRGEEFSQSWENGVLSSIAAVITKGDDWQILLNFMQSKGMTDYRIAFSFYGVLNGFANLTRDFTDILLAQKNTYVADVYREFHGQLHGVSIDINQNATSVAEQAKSDHNMNNQNESPISSLAGCSEIKSKNSQVKEIWRVFYSFAPKSGQKKINLERGLRLCLDRHSVNIDYSQFVMELNDFDEYGWSKSNKPWKSMQEYFCPDYNEKVGQKKRTTKKKQEQSPSFFDKMKEGFHGVFDMITDLKENEDAPKETKPSEKKLDMSPTSQLLINDDNIILFIQALPYVKGSSYLEKLKENILYLQEGYKPGGKYGPGGIKESDPSNKQVIKHLGHLITYSDKSPALSSIVQALQKDLYLRYDVQ